MLINCSVARVSFDATTSVLYVDDVLGEGSRSNAYIIQRLSQNKEALLLPMTHSGSKLHQSQTLVASLHIRSLAIAARLHLTMGRR